MKPALFYDTETTGLPLFSEPSEDPRQPHIVQLAAVLVDLESRNQIASMDVIIKPEGWTIPDEVAQVHGITTDRALEVGVPERLAIDLFMELWGGRLRIAHNEQFDARILRIALMRNKDNSVADYWKASSAECTARLSTPICALPPTEKMKAAKRFHHKTPNLGEAYRHFWGVDFENAHSAMADVQACIEVYFAVQDAKKEMLKCA
jgi:DNA polymerase-3 subunit epsilon